MSAHELVLSVMLPNLRLISVGIYAQNRKQVELLLAVQWHLGLLAMILLFPEQPRMTGYVKH
jgi:hypothetical protein